MDFCGEKVGVFVGELEEVRSECATLQGGEIHILVVRKLCEKKFCKSYGFAGEQPIKAIRKTLDMLVV